jgi:hypothetical protein
MLTRILTTLLLFLSSTVFSQQIEKIINAQEVKRIEAILASDDMQGRKAGTPGIEKAADFIDTEFKKAGLLPLTGATGFRQPFKMVAPSTLSVDASAGGAVIPENHMIIISPMENIEVTPGTAFQHVAIKAGTNFGAAAYGFLGGTKDVVVHIDSTFRQVFPRLNRLKGMMFPNAPTVIFVLGSHDSASFRLKAAQQLNEVNLSNIVGMIPGKSRKDEYVIFSAHYDHMGIGDPVDGDSIYNGANDDAAGTTAVIMLSRYFKSVGGNERTLLFAAFTAEEIGGFGSQYFSKQFPPEKVMAMLNIEMIGTPSKWGKNAAFITGFEKTDMGKVLQSNLKGSSFKFYPDPYKEQDLFYRSDNATLARLGVPAHTISTSKMDVEPNYHTVNDEIETLDMENMAMIIRAIALSARSIISGKETPTRVDPGSLTR